MTTYGDEEWVLDAVAVVLWYLLKVTAAELKKCQSTAAGLTHIDPR
jgi:hypothetical protein